MLQQSVTPFPGPDLDVSRSLQLAEHLGPGHLEIVNLPLGFVNEVGKQHRPTSSEPE